MIISMDLFDEEMILDTTAQIEKINQLEFTNMLLDKIVVTKTSQTEVDCSEEMWGEDTILAGEFQGTTEFGSLGAYGEKIKAVRIKKRKNNTGNWQTIYELEYDQDIDGWVEYNAKDKYIESYGEYEYCIVPVTENYEGIYNINKIETKFDFPILFDADHYYDLTYDFKISNLQKETPNSVHQTLGGKYPTVVYNGDISYYSGSVSCKIIVPDEEEYDKFETKKLRNEIMEFLLNKKPKILKTPDGFYWVINIINTPTLTYYDKAENIYDLTFSFVEIGDGSDQETMEQYGLIGVSDRIITSVGRNGLAIQTITDFSKNEVIV